MFEDTTFYIPTRGRADNQVTIDNLTPEILKRTFLLVDEDEELDYLDTPVGVITMPTGLTGIGNVRQWAVDNCSTSYMFLIDDDMVFFKRTDGSVKLKHTTNAELNNMFDTMLDWLSLDGFPVVGLSARQGNNRQEADYTECNRQMNFHGINIYDFNRLKLKFNGLEVMEDFNMLLHLFTQGVSNRVMYQFCWNQVGSGAKGGCSEYRDNKLQAKCANELHRRFPDFVTVVEKESKTAWKGMETRTDVRVQWKKALQYGESKQC